jgi:hypothetical protein
VSTFNSPFWVTRAERIVHSPAMNFGQATLRMMQFFERVKDASEVCPGRTCPPTWLRRLPFPRVQSVYFSAYQLLVSEYFLDQAVLELTLTGAESREFCEYAQSTYRSL